EQPAALRVAEQLVSWYQQEAVLSSRTHSVPKTPRRTTGRSVSCSVSDEKSQFVEGAMRCLWSHPGGQAPRSLRTAIICPIWYAAWSTASRTVRRYVCPVPCGIRDVRSTSLSVVNFSSSIRSFLIAASVSFH